MSTDQAKMYIAQAQDALAKALTELGGAPVPPMPSGKVLRPGDDVQAILNAAVSGAVFTVDPALVWTPPLIIPRPVTLLGPTGTVRMDETTPLPKFLNSITVAGSNVSLSALDARNAVAGQEILILQGANTTLDRMRVLGSPTAGQHRGINGNAPNVKLLRSYVDHIWADIDTQAFAAWDSPGPFLIDDCYLSASGETVLFGGADSATQAGTPSDITIQNATLTKRLDWRGKAGIGVKNTLELKNARRVKVSRCIIEHAWAQGQEGFLIVLTPRNQSGTNPWAAVQDVLIQQCQIRYGSAVCNMLGSDSDNPSGTLQRVQFLDNQITGIDPSAWGSVPGSTDPNTWGANKMFQLGQAPTDIAIQQFTSHGCKNIGSWLYFYGAKSVNITVTDNGVPPSTYGIWGEFGGFDASTTGVCQNVNNNVVPQ